MNIGSKLLRPFKKDLNLNYLLKRVDRESRVSVNINLQKNILNFYNKIQSLLMFQWQLKVHGFSHIKMKLYMM